MDYVIDKGVPLPEDMRGGGTIYPFDQLEVGDSIFFTLSDSDNAKRLRNRLAQASRTFGKKQEPEWHFVLRFVLENEVSGVRVWRRD